MDSKDQALDLINTFMALDNMELVKVIEGKAIGLKSLQMAKITVDKIIEFGNDNGLREPLMHWQRVKHELNRYHKL